MVWRILIQYLLQISGRQGPAEQEALDFITDLCL
jgi:hypothetical protein